MTDTLAFGLFLPYHIGLVDGLLTRRSPWTPE
jgi:hypothetical protein